MEEWLAVFRNDSVADLQTMLRDTPRDMRIRVYNSPYTPLMLAVMYDGVQCLKWLLSNGFDNVDAASELGITALLIAMVGKSDCVVPLLLAHGASPNGIGNVAPLQRALDLDMFTVAKLLIDAGAFYDPAKFLESNGVTANIMLVKRRRWNQRAIALRNALYASRQRIARDVRTTILRAFYALRWQ